MAEPQLLRRRLSARWHRGSIPSRFQIEIERRGCGRACQHESLVDIRPKCPDGAAEVSDWKIDGGEDGSKFRRPSRPSFRAAFPPAQPPAQKKLAPRGGCWGGGGAKGGDEAGQGSVLGAVVFRFARTFSSCLQSDNPIRQSGAYRRCQTKSPARGGACNRHFPDSLQIHGDHTQIAPPL